MCYIEATKEKPRLEVPAFGNRRFAVMASLDYSTYEMQAVTKMADLTKFRQSTWRFYANYINTDGPDMLNLTILATFMQIISPEMGLTCWRIWPFWRFLCKLYHQRRVLRVGEFDDFYAIYIIRDGSNVLANLIILAILITSWVEQKAMYSSLVLITVLFKWN